MPPSFLPKVLFYLSTECRYTGNQVGAGQSARQAQGCGTLMPGPSWQQALGPPESSMLGAGEWATPSPAPRLPPSPSPPQHCGICRGWREEGSPGLERPGKRSGTVSGWGLPDSRLLNKEQKDPSGVMLTLGPHPPTAALRARRRTAATG